MYQVPSGQEDGKVYDDCCDIGTCTCAAGQQAPADPHGDEEVQREPDVMACIIATKAVYGGGNRRGGTIKVQPTAIARRRPGITRGNKRVPAGRPSKGLPAKRAKKEHSFSTNMKKDVPNAKSHGIGH
ncbi:hypothetical protein IscW_ISCW005118 [Ixodes scapularis]|uniref:Uncharacterized protein n=1 Tax=Ixodes scapularis TaxID=6945 RepID=B7PEQ9_IXOSC|nr:hypothetical protein IscW_ISCW005118 [Ixodes scapularis]|eukprot:XP_002433681.1 hypothetical protein IscW_ISCW005118 [Ixodes scapularis]